MCVVGSPPATMTGKPLPGYPPQSMYSTEYALCPPPRPASRTPNPFHHYCTLPSPSSSAPFGWGGPGRNHAFAFLHAHAGICLGHSLSPLHPSIPLGAKIGPQPAPAKKRQALQGLQTAIRSSQNLTSPLPSPPNPSLFPPTPESLNSHRRLPRAPSSSRRPRACAPHRTHISTPRHHAVHLTVYSSVVCSPRPASSSLALLPFSLVHLPPSPNVLSRPAPASVRPPRHTACRCTYRRCTPPTNPHRNCNGRTSCCHESRLSPPRAYTAQPAPVSAPQRAAREHPHRVRG
jgi:hypothetical protein